MSSTGLVKVIKMLPMQTENGVQSRRSPRTSNEKGRVGKYEEHRQLKANDLNKERATRMEGSFGTEPTAL